MLQIKEYHGFKFDEIIITKSTRIQCYDDLPPIPEEILSFDGIVIKDCDSYLGRSTKQLREIGLEVYDIRNVVEDISRGKAIYILDGYNFMKSIPHNPRKNFNISKMFIGTIKIEPEIANKIVQKAQKWRKTLIFHDHDYDIYMPIPPRIQWISRINKPSGTQLDTIRKATAMLFNRTIASIILYQYSFGGYIALLDKSKEGNLFYHAYRPSADTSTGQTYIVLQKDDCIIQKRWYKLDRNDKDFNELFVKLSR